MNDAQFRRKYVSVLKPRIDRGVTIHEHRDGIKTIAAQDGTIFKFSLVDGSINGTESPVGTKGSLIWNNGLPFFQPDNEVVRQAEKSLTAPKTTDCIEASGLDSQNSSPYEG